MSEQLPKSDRVLQLERALKAGVATINEARELVGLPKLADGGDHLFVDRRRPVGFDIPGGHRYVSHDS